MQVAELYDLDFAEWARRNAELLRSGRVSEADLEHIAEEIEAMAKRERRALHNHLVRLIEHLLKWEYQPERRGASWQLTIMEQRRRIGDVLDDNPSLRPMLPMFVLRAYGYAVLKVAKLLRRQDSVFPSECPYTVEQVVHGEYPRD